MDKYQALERLKKARSKCCSLCSDENKVVFGEGDIDAKIIFVGEAPGANEAMTGRPFVGRAGKVLDGLLKVAKIRREDVYITSLLKCRPPKNRNPKPKEIESCTPILKKQIEIIKPNIICTLGNFATKYFLREYGVEQKFEGITKIHGKTLKVGDIKIIPLFHPAVVVYNKNLFELLKKDFRMLRKYGASH
jgi:DNA polymerase